MRSLIDLAKEWEDLLTRLDKLTEASLGRRDFGKLVDIIVKKQHNYNFLVEWFSYLRNKQGMN